MSIPSPHIGWPITLATPAPEDPIPPQVPTFMHTYPHANTIKNKLLKMNKKHGFSYIYSFLYDCFVSTKLSTENLLKEKY